jgi:hypothetical protein
MTLVAGKVSTMVKSVPDLTSARTYLVELLMNPWTKSSDACKAIVMAIYQQERGKCILEIGDTSPQWWIGVDDISQSRARTASHGLSCRRRVWVHTPSRGRGAYPLTIVITSKSMLDAVITRHVVDTISLIIVTVRVSGTLGHPLFNHPLESDPDTVPLRMGQPIPICHSVTIQRN